MYFGHLIGKGGTHRQTDTHTKILRLKDSAAQEAGGNIYRFTM